MLNCATNGKCRKGKKGMRERENCAKKGSQCMSLGLPSASLSVDGRFFLFRIKQRLQDLDIDVDEPEAFKKEFKRLLVTPPRPSYYKIDKYSPRPVLSTPIEIYNLVREGRPLTEEGETL